MAYINVSKPTGSPYSKVNQSLTGFDDSTVFFDGVAPDNSIYTRITKPTSSVYTKISKPS